MDYKEKYENALERASKLRVQNPFDTVGQMVEHIFPELKESEDEKIRKSIIKILTKIVVDTNYKELGIDFSLKDMVAWLEKQSKKKEYTFKSIPRLLNMIVPSEKAKSYCQKLIDTLTKEGYDTDAKIVADYLKQMNGEGVAMATMDEDEKRGENKPAENVEIKFCEGDKVVSNQDGKVYTVGTEYYITGDNICLHDTDGNHLWTNRDDLNRNYHLWTIADAMDGDVLVCNINKAEIGGDIEKLPNMTLTICIYQNVVKDSEYIHSYCSLYDENSLVLQNTMYYNKFVYNIQPATKEQCDLLFQKMKEAGYEWDDNKKELKKVEQNPADKIEPKFHPGDWIVGNEGIFKIIQYEDEYGYDLTDTTGCVVHFICPDYVESNFHLWTIEDVKKGDVLVHNGCPFIFMGIKDGIVQALEENLLEGTNPVNFGEPKVDKDYQPSIKGQQELLFQKMKEAGYEWDANKKELKKMESKTLDADKAIKWIRKYWPFKCWGNVTLLADDAINKFKKDFGL